MLGVIYHAQGRFSDAEEAFENALRLNPRYTEAALNLSVTYNDRGKYDRAREVYTKAVSASVGQPNALDRFARGKLANMHADLGAAYAGLAMFDEAVREYAKALDLCPDFADLRVRLGNVYRDMGMFHAAVAEFEHAKKLRPDFIPARIHLGVTLFSLGRKRRRDRRVAGGPRDRSDQQERAALHPHGQRRERPAARLRAAAVIAAELRMAIAGARRRDAARSRTRRVSGPARSRPLPLRARCGSSPRASSRRSRHCLRLHEISFCAPDRGPATSAIQAQRVLQ